ncbi:hypothetical protein Tco_0767364 [Tanacetum coccineum]
MSSNTLEYIYPIIVPSDSNVKDAFSSITTPDYTPASPDYSLASSGNTSPGPSDDLSKYLLASLAILPFYDDPCMKDFYYRDTHRGYSNLPRSDMKSLLDKIRELKNHKGGPPDY